VLDRLPGPAREPLRRWAAQTGTVLKYHDWSGRGKTAAQLIAVYAQRHGEPPRTILIKYCPPDDDLLREPGRHAKARALSPSVFFETHMVRQEWDAVPLPDDGWIMFQRIAGGSLRGYAPLDRIVGDHGGWDGPVARLCERAVTCVLEEWNSSDLTLPEARVDVPGFLRALLGARIDPGGKVDVWAQLHPGLTGHTRSGYPNTIELPGEPGLFPHPIVFARDRAPTRGRRLLPLLGHKHGDLHSGNIIASVGEEEDTRHLHFIDLSNYNNLAPLVFDPAHLLVASVGACLPELTDKQRDDVSRLLVHRGVPAGNVPNGLYELCRRVREAGTRWADGCEFLDEWTEQYLLALVGCGLLFAARRTTRDEDRPWFFHLAARAARAYLEFLGPDTSAHETEGHTSPPPADAPVMARSGDVGPAVPEGHRWLWGVPPRVPYAIARTESSAAVRRLMEQLPSMPVAVYGAPGTGKSTLAAECAHAFAEDDEVQVAWFACDPMDLLTGQLAGIARDVLGEKLVAVEADEVFGALVHRGAWLAVFDGAPDCAQVAPFVQAARNAGMRVLITSRSPRFGQLARILDLAGFDRAESIRLLRHFVDELPEADADAVAAALGDLPLALMHAGEQLQGSAMTAAYYLRSLTASTESAVAQGAAPTYPARLGASVSLALDRLTEQTPSAVQLLRLCAFFAPARIPFDVLAKGYEHLPFDIPVGADPTLVLAQTVSAASDSGLLRAGYGYCHLHPVFQKLLRAGIGPAEAAQQARRARAILSAADPGDHRDPKTWSGYRELLPHVFELGLSRAPEPQSCRLVLSVAGYLTGVGDAPAALKIADETARTWEGQCGRDAPETLAALSRKAQAQFQSGEYRAAAAIDEEVLSRRRRILDDGHPDTLEAMDDLAVNLTTAGRAAGPDRADLLARAGELHRGVVAARQGLPPGGDNGLALLRSMHNLAFHLRIIADHEGARSLEDEVYTACRRQLGEHYPLTLRSAHALALDLRKAGDHGRARMIEEAAYTGYRDTLGPDHSDTLRAKQFLIRDLRAAGEHDRARELQTDLIHRLERRWLR
jgi:Tetratricopeptide repeat